MKIVGWVISNSLLLKMGSLVWPNLCHSLLYSDLLALWLYIICLALVHIYICSINYFWPKPTSPNHGTIGMRKRTDNCSAHQLTLSWAHSSTTFSASSTIGFDHAVEFYLIEGKFDVLFFIFPYLVARYQQPGVILEATYAKCNDSSTCVPTWLPGADISTLVSPIENWILN